MIRARIALVPSGHLLLGPARVAMVNALFARHQGGPLLLRFDDLETQRPDIVTAISQDLAWLGITPDQTLHQAERAGLYAEAIDRLKQSGRLYPCFESQEELRAKRDRRLKRGQPAVYDRAMLQLTEAQRRAAEANGKRPYWRFRLSDETVEWRDAILGSRAVKLPAVSDPVLVPADGLPLPLLAGTVDDLALGVTHLIQGEDQLVNSAMQRDLMLALGADPRRVTLAHLPALSEGGGMFGRRVATRTLRSLRADGVEPAALAAALIGAAAPAPLEQLAAGFDLAALPAGPVSFDGARLLAFNRTVLAEAAFPAVADRLPLGATEAFWLAVRQHLDLLTEARGWWDVVAGTIVPPVIDDGADTLSAAMELLPPEPWSSGVCADWVGAISHAVGRAPEAVLRALRLALTGEEQGPDLAALLPLIGRARAVHRLQIAAA